jgi:hypothetical protein
MGGGGAQKRISIDKKTEAKNYSLEPSTTNRASDLSEIDANGS